MDNFAPVATTWFAYQDNLNYVFKNYDNINETLYEIMHLYKTKEMFNFRLKEFISQYSESMIIRRNIKFIENAIEFKKGEIRLLEEKKKFEESILLCELG
jgi:hypothetical protein